MSAMPDGLVVHELFACGVAGYLYKNDPLRTALADAIARIVEEPGVYIRPRHEIEEAFSLEQTVAGYEALFRSLIDR